MTATAEWGRADTVTSEGCQRAATLVYRVASGVGISRRRAVRICRQLAEDGLLPTGDFSRAARHALLAVVRSALGPRVATGRLRRALGDAQLLDEYDTLPESQRQVVEAVHGRHLSLVEAAAVVGCPTDRAAVLLRDALRTLSANVSW